jgi:hypothetical protein
MRLAISIAAVLIALVAALFAIGFFALALYQWLATQMEPALAALATGVIILLAALLLIFATKFAGKPKKRKIIDDASLEACESAAELGGVLGRKLRGLAEAHGNSSLWAALLAGFAVGVSPRLRTFLRHLLKV